MIKVRLTLQNGESVPVFIRSRQYKKLTMHDEPSFIRKIILKIKRKFMKRKVLKNMLSGSRVIQLKQVTIMTWIHGIRIPRPKRLSIYFTCEGCIHIVHKMTYDACDKFEQPKFKCKYKEIEKGD